MEATLQKRKKGLLYGVLTTIFLSLNLIPIKILLADFDSLFVSFGLCFVVGFLILPVLLVIKRYNLRSIGRSAYIWILLIGVFAAGIGNYLSVLGISLLPISQSAFLLQFEAVFAALIAFVWLKEKMSKGQIIGTLNMVLGAYFLSGAAGFAFTPGLLYIICATFLFGLTDVMIKKLPKDISIEVVIGLRFLIGAIVILIIGFPTLKILPSINLNHFFLIILASGSVFFFVSFLYKCIRYLPQAVGTLFLIPGLIFSAIFGIIFFGEILTLSHVIGIIFILGGLVLGTGVLSVWQKKART